MLCCILGVSGLYQSPSSLSVMVLAGSIMNGGRWRGLQVLVSVLRYSMNDCNTDFEYCLKERLQSDLHDGDLATGR